MCVGERRRQTDGQRNREREKRELVTELQGDDFEKEGSSTESQKAFIASGPEHWSVPALCETTEGL